MLDVDTNDVTPVTRRLKEAGFIRKLPERGRYNAIYFERLDAQDMLWRCIAGLYEDHMRAPDASRSAV